MTMLQASPGAGGRLCGRRIALGLAVVCWCGVATGAMSQGLQPRTAPGVYPRTSSAAEGLLRSAELHTREGQYESAIELLRRAVEQHGDSVTLLGDGGPAQDPLALSVYVNIRQYCQRLIASMPPAGLKAYRSKVDGEAGDRFRRGRDGMDEDELRWVVENAFCSSWGDDAVELLADSSFRAGRFDEALSLYRLLAPDENRREFFYPDPGVSLAVIRAKKLLCLQSLGRLDAAGAAAAVAALPADEASLAGRTGPLSEILAESLAADGLGDASRRMDLAQWPTLAGSPSRSRAGTDQLDIGALQWTHDFAKEQAARQNLNAPFQQMNLPGPGRDRPPLPMVHPILLGDEVLICDGLRVLAFKLGRQPDSAEGAVQPYWHGEDPEMTTFPAATAGPVRQPMTLTAHGDRIFVRLGDQGGDPRFRDAGTLPRSTLLAVQRSSQGKLIWKVHSDQIMETRGGSEQPLGAGFGGTPVADDEGVYVALIKPGPQAMTWVACLDPETGQLKWLRFVCGSSPTAVEDRDVFRPMNLVFDPDLGHRLLSLEGTTLYYQTDLGALASVNARTGTLNWLTTYPRDVTAAREKRETAGLRPAVVAGGLVFVSPSDSRRIYAFDADTGRLVWKADPPDRVDHLLGVADGKLVATGDFVWTFDAASGRLLSQWPDQKAPDSGYGRGLISAGEIYWPTEDRLYVLDLSTGRPSRRPPIELRELYRGEGGNLIAGEGYVVVAQSGKLAVYCQNSRLLQRYKDLIAAKPDDGPAHYQLARVAEATGDEDLALAELAAAARLAAGSDRVDGEPMARMARSRRSKLLVKRAVAASEAKDWGRAIASYDEAARDAVEPDELLAIALDRAKATVESGQAAEAVAILHRLLADPASRQVVVRTGATRRIRGDLLVVSRLEELRAADPAAFGSWDERAEEVRRKAVEARDRAGLLEVVQSYPTSPSAAPSLAELARLELEEGDPASAQTHFLDLLATTRDLELRAVAQLGIGESFEKLGEHAEARRAYETAASSFDTIRLGGTDGALTIGEIARRRVQEMTPVSSGPGPSEGLAPWRRGAMARREAGEAWLPLGTAGLDGSELDGLLVDDHRVRAVSLDGERAVLWERDLEGRASWAAALGKRVVVATTEGLYGLSASNGSVVWTYVGDRSENPDEPDPFTKRPAGPRREADAPTETFTLVGGRLYVQRGKSSLASIDTTTGQVAWTFSPEEGELNSHALFGPSRLLLQVIDPNSRVVLDATTGEMLQEVEDPASVAPWVSAPVALAGGHAAMTMDARTIVAMDLATGSTLWENRDVSVLPRFAPASLFGDGQRLFAISAGSLLRIDPSNGQEVWKQEIGAARGEWATRRFLAGQGGLFAIGPTGSDLTLVSLDPDAGRVVWRRTLQRAGWGDWGLAWLGDDLLASPLGTSEEGRKSGRLPLQVYRPDDGRPVQRMVLPSVAAIESLQSARSGFIVATREGVYRYSGSPGEGGGSHGGD